MERFLILAALACHPGDRLVDLKGKLPRDLQFVSILVSVEPFYSRVYIYRLGLADSFQQCCGNKSTSVLHVPIGDGRFCLRQSQPRMKWSVRVLVKPSIEM
jgi:hypothetical protein